MSICMDQKVGLKYDLAATNLRVDRVSGEGKEDTDMDEKAD